MPASGLTPFGRGKKRSREESENPAVSPSRRPARHDLPSGLLPKSQPRAISPLERLPTEIIQQIFSYFPLPSFARASPFLSSALSSPRFFDSDIYDKYFCAFKRADGRYYVSHDAAECSEDLLMRSQVLSCRWMNHNRFQKLCTRVYDLEDKRLEQCYNAGHPSLSHLRRMKAELELNLLACFPRRLLRWPLNEADRRFIETLARTGCVLDSAGMTGELAVESLRLAIESRNYSVVFTLMAIGACMAMTESDLFTSLDAIEWEDPMVRLIYSTLLWSKRQPEFLYSGLVERAAAYHGHRKLREGQPLFPKDLRRWMGCPCHLYVAGMFITHPAKLCAVWMDGARDFNFNVLSPSESGSEILAPGDVDSKRFLPYGRSCVHERRML